MIVGELQGVETNVQAPPQCGSAPLRCCCGQAGLAPGCDGFRRSAPLRCQAFGDLTGK